MQYKKKTCGGFHKTQALAAETLRRVMGLASVQELPTIATPEPEKHAARNSRYHGVTFDRRSGKWVAVRVRLGKSFDSEAAAAAAVREALASRKRQHPASSVLGQLKSAKEPKTILRRVRFLSRVYHRNKQLLLPADVQACLARWRLFRKMFKQEPTTEVICLQSKYGPWMDALKEAWDTRPQFRSLAHDSSSSASSDRGRALILHDVLVRTAEKIQEAPVPEKWVEHAGRSVCRHSGGCQVLRGLGIITKSPAATSAAFYEHLVGKKHGGYKILRSSKSILPSIGHVVLQAPTCRQHVMCHFEFAQVHSTARSCP